MGKRIGDGVKRTTLSLVGSVADSSAPKVSEERARKRNEALIKARATANANKAKRDAERVALREAGVPTPLERFRAGEYPVSEWSIEEIKRGRPANRDGTFDGPWPRLTGKQQSDIRRELLKRGQAEFDQAHVEAIKVLVQIAKSGEKDGDRVKAALAIIERVAGKVPDKVEIKSSDPWQDILDEIMDDEVLHRMSDHTPAQGDSDDT
jgi:hypothetical protein